MIFRGHFLLLLIASVSVSNLGEAASVNLTLAKLDNEASDGTFELAWELSGKVYENVTSRPECGQYLDKDVINKAEMRMIIAYSHHTFRTNYSTQFHKHLNKELRENGIGSSKYSTAIDVLLEALRKLGNHQRSSGDIRLNGPLYRMEMSKDIYTNSRGNLTQFTATFIDKQLANNFKGTFGALYPTTLKNPAAGAYVGECSYFPMTLFGAQFSVVYLLPVGLPYVVEEAENTYSVILNLQTNPTTTTTTTTTTNTATTTTPTTATTTTPTTATTTTTATTMARAMARTTTTTKPKSSAPSCVPCKTELFGFLFLLYNIYSI